MKSISNNISNEIIINKSKFITYLIKVNNVDDITNELDKLKEQYKGATHYCYAYIIGNIKRFNDDGEPGGTAGMPILNVLENNNLDNILAVVIRYFGGIKLGAGGLVRAYTNAITKCLELINIKDYEYGNVIEISFDPKNTNLINAILNNNKIVSKNFTDKAIYKILVLNKEQEIILEKLNNYIYDYSIIKEELIEKAV